MFNTPALKSIAPERARPRATLLGRGNRIGLRYEAATRLIRSAAMGLLAACNAKTSDAPTACEAYLDCLVDEDPDRFLEQAKIYGENGSCFEHASQACQDLCTQSSQDQGCPESDTSASANTSDQGAGQLDCADLHGDAPIVAGGDVSPLGFPTRACDPRRSGKGDYTCCSDDPSTADGKLPSYAKMTTPDSSPPLYADAANGRGTSGMCVNRSQTQGWLVLTGPAVTGCPVPCNPTWDVPQIEAVCGPGRVCCQTIELGDKDCVQERDSGTWRPVTGADIGDSNVVPATVWGPTSHQTHQDPNGTVCTELARGEQGSSVFRECIRHLTVANQRGYCMGAGTSCPGTAPSYVNACAAKNGK